MDGLQQTDPYASIAKAIDPYAAIAKPVSGAAPGQVLSPAGLPAALTANPNGEGTYKMVGPQGQTSQVPFSKVRAAQDQQFAVHPDDAARYQKDAAAAQPGVLDNLASWGRRVAPVETPEQYAQRVAGIAAEKHIPTPGPLEAATGRFASNAMNSAVQGLTALPSVVQHKLSDLGNASTWTPAGSRAKSEQEMQAAQDAGTLKVIEPGQPLPAVTGADASDYGSGLAGVALEAAALGDAAGGLAKLPSVVRQVPEAVGGAVRSTLAPGLDEPIPGANGLTPRARYAAAKNLGVQLDAADAVGGGVLPLAKTGNVYSMTARGVYGKTLAGNVQALTGATDDALAGMSPLDADAGGRLIQDRLKADHAGLHQDAAEGFKWLDEATGGAPVPGASVVGQTAQKILADNRDFFAKYPSMAPNSALNVIKDVAKVGDTASYSELQRLRSNVLDSIRSNPDLVKDQSTAWLQQLASVLDNTITDKGLTPEQTQVFRAANQKWTDLKGSYDNPANPLKYAITSPTPSKLVLGVGGKTPEALQDLAPRIGSDGMGVVQRRVTENLLGNTKDGEYNLGGFGRKYYGLPDAYRDALYTPEQQEALGGVASTANAIGKDLNPSGTAKMGIPAAEFGELGSTLLPAMHGNVLPAIASLAYHGAQYGLAKLINSPTFADWLMQYERDGGAASGGGLEGPPTLEGAAAKPAGGLPPVVPLAASPVAPVEPAARSVGDAGNPFAAPAAGGLPPVVPQAAAEGLGAPEGKRTAADVRAESARIGGPVQPPWWAKQGGTAPAGTPTLDGNPFAAAAPGGLPSVVPQAPVRMAGVEGDDTFLHTPNQVLPAKYRVVEAGDVTPSHDAMTFRPNPNYPAGVQERDYAGQKENQLRVITNAQRYKPQMVLTDDPTGVNGPPVVTPDGTVLGGNSRAMSLQRVYAGLGPDANGSSYRNYLLDKAGRFGLDPDAIRGMRQPMLVREVTPEGGLDGMRRLGSDLNKSMTGAMGGSERAVSMGKSVSAGTLNLVRQMLNEAGDGATLRDVMSDPTRSNALLRRMQDDGVLTDAQRPEFVDAKTGGMNDAGKTLLERALLGAVVGDPAALEAAPKSITAKLTGSIGPLAGLGSRSDEWNILPQLRTAIAEHGKIASSGIGVENHLAQPTLGRQLTPLEAHLTRVLAENPTWVRDAFGVYGKDAQYAIPGQASFLGPTAGDAFNHAFGGKLTPGEFMQR